jgi:hypothetical protein
MILSRGRGFLFVHIPKTGGTAFTLAYEARAMKDDILVGDTPKARARRKRLDGVKTAGRLWKHSTLSDLIGLISPDELEGLTTLTMVRNPWDRVVSYYHWLRAQHFGHPAVGLAKSHQFSGFLNHPQITTSLRLWPSGAYLRRADGSEKPSLFLRLEHFAEDVAPFERQLGFSLTLPVANKSDRGADWRPYYSDADAALVGEICAEDIGRFGYRFDPERN